MQDQWGNSQRPNFLMGGIGTPYKPGESNNSKYTPSAAAAVRLGRTNEQAAADLRAMLYKDEAGTSTVSKPLLLHLTFIAIKSIGLDISQWKMLFPLPMVILNT